MALISNVLKEDGYRQFAAGYGVSFVLYWVTLMAVGWWTWETTQSAAWVGFMFFCDLFPAVLITPWASALADRGDRFLIMRIVLWSQLAAGVSMAALTAAGLMTPWILAGFVFLEGAFVGTSQPAFFGFVNRLVRKENLAAAVSMNVSITQTAYVLGPLLAGLVFSFGLAAAPYAFAANAVGTLVYLWTLSRITLHPEPPRDAVAATSLRRGIFDGLSVFWQDQTVFRALALTLAAAVLQRPLVSLMPGINSHYSFFDPAYFTVLTACFMGGSVMAGLTHARRNSTAGLARLTPLCLGATSLLFIAFFSLAGSLPYPVAAAGIAIGLIGYGCGFTWTGNTVILRSRTPEHLRSRVLGNSFMLTRAIGAVAVAATGFAVEIFGVPSGMGFAAALAALLLAASRLPLRRAAAGEQV